MLWIHTPIFGEFTFLRKKENLFYIQYIKELVLTEFDDAFAQLKQNKTCLKQKKTKLRCSSWPDGTSHRE
jgi:hypothetical protein